MRKFIITIVVFSLLLTSCSVDWNDEKDKKNSDLSTQIADYRKQIADLNDKLTKQEIEKEKLDFEKTKYEEEKQLNQAKDEQAKLDKEKIDSEKEAELVRTYTKECAVSLEKLNKNLMDMVNNGCQTKLCQDNVIANPHFNPQKLPYDYVDDCVNKKEQGAWKWS